MKLKLAILISLLLHLGLLALLLVNFQFKKIEVKNSGSQKPPINATAVDAKRVEQLVETIKQKKRDEQKRLEDIKKAEQEQAKRKIQEDKRKAQEKKDAEIKKQQEAEAQLRKQKQQAEQAKKAEALKKRKEKEAAESKAKQEAEQKAKEKQQAEQKRKAKEEAERKKKEAEERARKEALEKEMQAQMDAEAAELAAAHQQQINSEIDKFNTLISNKIKNNWFKPEQRGRCTFRIQIAATGLVLQIEALSGSPLHCESGRRAIMRAEPLPMSKDPDVYQAMKIRTFDLENESDE